MFYKSSVIRIGDLLLGGDYPVRVQSMTNTNTLDTRATVDQAIRMIEEGSELVRITAQGVREAQNLKDIKEALHKRGYSVPLIADIHYNPKAAEIAAAIVEKVRINPGNYLGSPHKVAEYGEVEYLNELEIITNNLKPLISICKEHGTAIRIGVNHGSLGSRIVGRYGDTVEGMVVSALEYARICRELNFHNLVLSVKSSNTVTMLNAYRELASALDAEGLNYPLHIGVTEAGNGEDGRMKSIVGIGAVLSHGIGDTIRVSLTEEPEAELPVAKAIVKRYSLIENNQYVGRKIRKEISLIDLNSEVDSQVIHNDREHFGGFPTGKDPAAVIIKRDSQYFLASPDGRHELLPDVHFLLIDKIPAEDTLSIVIEKIREHNANAFILQLPAHLSQCMIRELRLSGCRKPVILMSCSRNKTEEDILLENCLHPGALLMDGYGQGICIDAEDLDTDEVAKLGFGILQATRTRITNTEYIACPSCGRTHFDIQQRLKEIKEATSGYKGLKIAVMGCIVNGPGEMADADYGYVGAGKGRITLYKGKKPIRQSIPEENALEELLRLIKDEEKR